MNTENSNIAPENGAADTKSDKKWSAKKVAGKTAQFAGAAGLGVAGTMAANAMDENQAEEDILEATIAGAATGTSGAHGSGSSTTATEAEEIDPNKIRIDDVKEGEITDGAIADDGNENGPITGMGDDASEDIVDIDIDDILIDPETGSVGAGVDEPLYAFDDRNDMDNFDDPNMYLADNGMDSPEPDILDDILNA